MVKFNELLELIGMIDGDAKCSCCNIKAAKLSVYKKGENMITLCAKCEAFIEELLRE